jgi:REP element-mobilizing transposase RayT
MANSYTQLYTHYVFAVNERRSLITEDIKERVYMYIAGIIKGLDCKLMVVNGMPDHVHILVSQNPKISVSEFAMKVKANSSRDINANNSSGGSKFNWQEGYGAFSYSKSQVHKVLEYIIDQEIHHQKETFQDEYIPLLTEAGIEFDEKYLFKPI